MPTDKKKTKSPVLDQYKDALQPMVDEALAVQTLAPAMEEAIIQNKPLNDTMQLVVKEAIERNPEVQQALDKAVVNSKAIKSSQSPLKSLVYWIPLIMSALLSLASLIFR